jgi:outer membrane protein assembly factor BamB
MSGRIVWEKTAYEGVPRTGRHVKATQANATPATDGKHVVALFGSEGLDCYDIDGKLLWKKDLGILNPGLWDDPKSSWGHSSSPVIYRDLVIIQADGHKQSFIAAFNLKDGKQVWRVERGEITSWSTPVINATKDRTELVANGGHYIRGYDPLTGKELWRFADGDTQVKMQAPQISQGLIYITGGYPAGRPIYAFRSGANGDISLKAGQETNEFIAWRSTKGSPYTPTPLVYDGLFYTCADSGVLSAYDAQTGALIYQERLPSSFSASPVAADGKLYLASEDGDVFVVKAGRKFELLATNPMGQALMATPAISRDLIVVRTETHVYAISANKTAGTAESNERTIEAQSKTRKVRLGIFGYLVLPASYGVYKTTDRRDAWSGYIECADDQFLILWTAGMVVGPFAKGGAGYQWLKSEALGKGLLKYGLKRTAQGNDLAATVGFANFYAHVRNEHEVNLFMATIRSFVLKQCDGCESPLQK